MLLINPSRGYYYFLPSAGLAYLAAVLERAGAGVRIIDSQVEADHIPKLLAAARRHRMAGLSVNIGNIRWAIKISRLLRRFEPQVKIVMGGPYASAIHSRLIPEHADIVVHGEGESVIVDIARDVDPAAIQGVSYWDGERIRATVARDPIDGLDEVPWPAWHHTRPAAYNFPAKAWPVAPVITSRGCPHRCINCTHIVHGYKLRARSPESVVDEMEYMVRRFRLREIQIWDDNFTFSSSRAKEICERIIRKNLNVALSVPNGIRADGGDEEMFRLMKRAGFYLVSIGVESGVQEIVDKLGKKLNLAKVRPTVERLNRSGLHVNLFFMLGLPWDTRATMRETIDFAKSLPVHMAHFHVTMPFPGTELFDLVERDGRFLQRPEVFFPTYQGIQPVYEIYDLTARDVREMAKRAYIEFYMRPAQVYRFLTKGIKYRRSTRGLWTFGKRVLWG